jgi:cell division protein FtsW
VTTTDDRPQVIRSRVAWLDRPLATYHLLVGAVLILTGLGLVMVFSASSVESYAESGSTWAVSLRQAMWAAIGLPLMFVISRLPVRTFRVVAYPLMILALALLVMVLVPGLGVEVNGSQNWLRIGPFQVQPSELTKLALIVWGADLLARKEKVLDQPKHLLVPLLPVCGALVLLMLIGGEMGTCMVVLAILFALLFFAGASWTMLVSLVAAGVSAILVLSANTGYRQQRITSWLDPSSDPLGAGWQAMHGTYALASGGVWGLGLGGSREKWGNLPAAHTDFIMAIVGEELGLIGTLVVLVLFGVIGFAGFRIAMNTNDTFVRLAAAALTVGFLVQAMVNVGAVIGLLPITGITLPLVSYGGTSLIATLVGLGMLMAMARSEPRAAAALRERAERRGRRPSLSRALHRSAS